MRRKRFGNVLCVLVALGLAMPANAARVKDVAHLSGVRDNDLTGYGLVVGLHGSGDTQQSQFTVQAVVAMLSRMGIRVDPTALRLRNVAAVMVTAKLPPFAQSGNRIDVVVSSMGDARSLAGGTLILTPLKAVDSQVYAMAQGPLAVGGFEAAGAGSRLQKNFPNVGRIPSGGSVERGVPMDLAGRESLVYLLHDSDFTTAQKMAEAIKAAGVEARAVDSRQVVVDVPEAQRQNPVELIAKVEAVDFETDVNARIVLNARTGTVVMGSNVRLGNVALAHGGLQVEVQAQNAVSQPNPLTQGQGVGVQNAQVNATEARSSVHLVEGGASLAELVQALNALGVTPRDLIDVLQAMKSAGALNAELEIQ